MVTGVQTCAFRSEDFTIESGKTKDMAAILKHFSQNERTVLVLKDDDQNIKRTARNIPTLSFLSYNRLLRLFHPLIIVHNKGLGQARASIVRILSPQILIDLFLAGKFDGLIRLFEGQLL